MPVTRHVADAHLAHRRRHRPLARGVPQISMRAGQRLDQSGDSLGHIVLAGAREPGEPDAFAGVNIEINAVDHTFEFEAADA